MSPETLTLEQGRALLKTPPAKPNKYRNRPTTVDGLRFASKREANRWVQLQTLERAGLITDLNRQVPFSLDVNGVHICRYIADFTYRENGGTVVEDAKGVQTASYVLKARLMKACHGLAVREV